MQCKQQLKEWTATRPGGDDCLRVLSQKMVKEGFSLEGEEHERRCTVVRGRKEAKKRLEERNALISLSSKVNNEMVAPQLIGDSSTIYYLHSGPSRFANSLFLVAALTLSSSQFFSPDHSLSAETNAGSHRMRGDGRTLLSQFAFLHEIEACPPSSLVIIGGSISVANHMPLQISDPHLSTRDATPSPVPGTQIMAVVLLIATFN